MDAHLSERVEMPSPYGGKEMPGCSPKYIATTPVGELQGSPTPPPAAHEMMDPSIFQELPASPVPNDYFAGVKGSRQPSRQSPLRRHLSTNKGDKDSLPVSPLPSPVPSPPPPAATAESDLRYPKPTSSPVPRTPSKPQQRPFQLNLPHGSAPGSPVNANVRPVPSIAVHAPEVPEPPSENSTLQQTPIRMKWKPLDYSGEDYHRDRG